MAGMKSLAKETAIYGLSSIIGRFLNWCLVPIYTNVFPADDYGIVTLIYSVVSLLLVILTYGMETGFFRFANHERWSDPIQVYSTALVALGCSSTIFIVLASIFSPQFAAMLDCPNHPSYIWMMAVTVGIDAFSSLPFAYLRFCKKALRFAALKFLNIGLNIGLNLFFIILCPLIWDLRPEWIAWFYDPDFGVGYIFLSNLISSVILLVSLYREILVARLQFCAKLFKEMLVYSWPLLVLGFAGIMNQNLDKIIFPALFPDKATAMAQLGIYGANYKIAIVMVMFTQAFRYAYEPFIFAQHKQGGANQLEGYRQAMKYFLIFGLLIFLGVMFYLDILKYFISPRYFSGLKVVPIVMMAELCMGITFNLSLWYKLTDRTMWGMWITLIGLIMTVGLNVVLIPRFGYMGCAWAAFGCYATMMVVSYLLGRHYYPIGYRVKRLAIYVVIAAVLYVVGCHIVNTASTIANLAIRTLLLISYGAIVLKIEGIRPSQLLPNRKK